MARKLSHYDRAGRARMVDVSAKSATAREAEASAFVAMNRDVLEALPENPKGDPLEVARLAGNNAGQRTGGKNPPGPPAPPLPPGGTIPPLEKGGAGYSKIKT